MRASSFSLRRRRIEFQGFLFEVDLEGLLAGGAEVCELALLFGQFGLEAPVDFLAAARHVGAGVALAIHLEGLVSRGSVCGYRELADAGHVSRARLSQILQLTQLAPDIQEELLFLPPPARPGSSSRTASPLRGAPGGLGAAKATIPGLTGAAQPLSRYTRSPARKKERSLFPCFRTPADRKPRTLCRCQPVSCSISRLVAPSGRPIRA